MVRKNNLFLLVLVSVLVMVSLVGCAQETEEPTSVLPSPSPFDSPVQPAMDPAAGGEGALLFHSNRSGNYDIYVLDLETGELGRLTQSQDHEIEPAISPDGTRIAFARTRTDPRGQDIYVMDVDGGNQERITFMENSIAMAPSWSPDGSQIAFYATQDGHFNLFVVPAEGGDVSSIPDSEQNDMMPAWSPDGSQIAFVSDRDGRSELYVMNADGSNPTRLTDSMADDWRPHWSPDGRYIVFQSDDTGQWALYVVEVETGVVEPVTEGIIESKMPSWSGDGSQIFYALAEDQGYNLYVIDFGGEVAHQLTNTTGVVDEYPVWIPR